MSREVRRVPANWEHPKYINPHRGECYHPMLQSSHAAATASWEEEDLPEWLEGAKLWAEGKVKTYVGRNYDAKQIITIEEAVAQCEEYRRPSTPTYQWWAGDAPRRPDPDYYMPDWPDEQCTHYQMYETTSEGTPISPVCASPEELARWLADNDASAFAGETATYDEWLRMIVGRGHSVASAVIFDGEWINGVAASGLPREEAS